ncbi:MAG: phosphate ABC transporter permease subunit PstC [Dehalococcoides mccartyi]|jgi:phosphate ABC transporter, permease protein PstC|uniref:Phosphate transport system permease protein n=2 Tax=root TaxID=1 RepID=A0A0V8M496_9CHLR|nr:MULTISPECIES: phosphate ABC transporter permease subunit PstC [Dehalococcoides]AII58912.1 phosphate ABC transporter permease [Dehalococcoides mccartyi CG4]AQU02629.1 phosphate ABC transporter permease subunit PstC [Dehalococcoides mccartyi]AQU03964.1 phosphate ABC transporter permease subunit PstC [Dehalococcoides mccartyi]KSV18441.1 phosphate ABC transporter permease [Dehalococcoides mccartyi]MBF4483149.1 phosphate ABC transporter permease subunit PstC [Dehalococcoides mccartyi]
MLPRYFTDKLAKYGVLITALVSILVLLAIAVFIIQGGLPLFSAVNPFDFLFGQSWSPTYDEYGILSMIVGSLLVTLGSMVIAVPLGIACAILLAEVAPQRVRNLLRPAVELLVGIPSVVYGLVGIMVIVPAIRNLGGTGYSVLAAVLVLSIMVLPTIISISEDSLRAVPRTYRDGSLALGASQWQTIWHVLLPAARSGVGASIVLGMGRAIGETMAMIMVIGNAVIIPTSPLDPARTLTGNIAVEINYAAGLHENALFATGLVLLILILILNSLATLALKRGEQHA